MGKNFLEDMVNPVNAVADNGTGGRIQPDIGHRHIHYDNCVNCLFLYAETCHMSPVLPVVSKFEKKGSDSDAGFWLPDFSVQVSGKQTLKPDS